MEFENIIIPQNMEDYLKKHNAAIRIIYNSTDAINGYGQILTQSVEVLRYAEWCTRINCNYHSLYKPFERGEKCNRHKIARGYIIVFSWTGKCGLKGERTLEEAWEDFIKKEVNK